METASPVVKLIVLRTRRLIELKSFYEQLGMSFVEERHGEGPLHYSTMLGEIVMELYPLAADAVEAEPIRLGFGVSDTADATFVTRLRATANGLRAVVRDPDGRAVELYQREG